jgi:hypothetical protein
MSATIVQEIIDVAYTQTSGFPAGSAVASITATLTGTALGNTTPVTVTVTLGAPSVTVPLTPDTYTWSLVNADSGGNALGGPFTGTGVVAAPATVTLNLASGLNFT